MRGVYSKDDLSDFSSRGFPRIYRNRSDFEVHTDLMVLADAFEYVNAGLSQSILTIDTGCTGRLNLISRRVCYPGKSSPSLGLHSTTN